MAVPNEKEKIFDSNKKFESQIEEKIYQRLTLHRNKYSSNSIWCECGAEILLIPDVKEMGRCIESHAEKHQKKEQNPADGKAAFEYIQDLLIKKVLEKAALEGNRK
ncbi:MAG TPA: hypothetical protein VF350_03775 [Candidatus Bathyarchaeia archaeon]